MPTDPWADFEEVSPAAPAASRTARQSSGPDPWADFEEVSAGKYWEGSANTAKQDPRWGVTDMKTLEENVMAPGRGVAKGLYNTFAGATRVLAPIPAKIGLGKVFPPLEDDPIEPGEETGSKVGQALAYLVPGGATRRLAGVVTQGAKAAGIATAQGHDPVLAGALGAAAPIVGPVVSGVAKVLKPQDALTVLKFVGRAAGLPIPGKSATAEIAVRGAEALSRLSLGKGIGALIEKGKTRIADEILEAVARRDVTKAAAAIAKAAEAHPEVAEALAAQAVPAVAAKAPTVGWDRAAFPAGKIATVGKSRIPTILTRPKTGKAPAGQPLTPKQREMQIEQLRLAQEAGLDIFEVFGGASK